MRQERPIIMDGTALARRRSPVLAVRAQAIREQRGSAPRLALLAFADASGTAPWVERKVRAGRDVGVDVLPVICGGDVSTAQAVDAVEHVIRSSAPDGVFLEFPFPEQVDGAAVTTALPERLDVDVMTNSRVRRYLEERRGPPPVTVSAALELVDGFGVDLSGLDGVLVGDASPFIDMFHAAFVRRGARMRPRVEPSPSDAVAAVADAQLVIVAAGSAGIVATGDIADGAVVIDVGYFNPGRRGDVDISTGIRHLHALAPVPGAIGPMTVSVLLERVLDFCEAELD